MLSILCEKVEFLPARIEISYSSPTWFSSTFSTTHRSTTSQMKGRDPGPSLSISSTHSSSIQTKQHHSIKIMDDDCNASAQPHGWKHIFIKFSPQFYAHLGYKFYVIEIPFFDMQEMLHSRNSHQPFESSVILELITLQQQLYYLTVQNPHPFRNRVWDLNCPIHQKMRERSSQCPRVISFRAPYQSSYGFLISQSISSQQQIPFQAQSPSQRGFQRLIHVASLLSAQRWILESISTIQVIIIPIQEHRFLYSPAKPVRVQYQSSDGSLISQSTSSQEHIPFQAQSPAQGGFQSLIHIASLISAQRWILESISTVNKFCSSSAKTFQAKYHRSEGSLIAHQSL